METTQQASQEQQIGGFVGKVLRENFGKGPEAVYVSMGSNFITIYLRNFMSPLEKVLQQQNQDNMLVLMRQKVMDKLLTEIKVYIELITGNTLNDIYYDWGLHNKSGIIAAICEKPFLNDTEVNENYFGKKELEEKIVEMSYLAEKAPEEVHSLQINPKTIIAIRTGLMVRIEKEFFRRGFGDLLKKIKHDMEKGYLHHNDDFEKILGKTILDCFVDWNFDLDKSLIIFILSDKQPNPIPQVEMDR